MKIKNLTNDLGLAFAGSILLAFISQLHIPLPFTPVPLTLQTLGVFLIGGLLGPINGFMSIFLYLLEGTLGLPVFAGGVAKPLWYNSSTAGFLVSFLITVPLIGKLLQHKLQKSWLYLFTALSIAQIIMFVFGMGWLAFFIGVQKAFVLGVLPFLVGAVIKIGLGVLLLKGLSITGAYQNG